MARRAASAIAARAVFAAPAAPDGRPHKTIADVRARFATISSKAPIDAAFRETFVRHKLLLAHTHPHFDLHSRDLAVKSVVQALGSGASKESPRNWAARRRTSFWTMRILKVR